MNRKNKIIRLIAEYRRLAGAKTESTQWATKQEEDNSLASLRSSIIRSLRHLGVGLDGKPY